MEVYFREGADRRKENCSATSDGCYSSTFKNNDIGAYLIRIPGDLDFGFPDCTFEGNKEDVKR